MQSSDVKVVVFADVDSDAFAFLQLAQSWLEQRNLHADAVLLNARLPELATSKRQKVAPNGHSIHAVEASRFTFIPYSAQPEPALAELLGPAIRSLNTIEPEEFSSALYRYSTHADLVLISQDMYWQKLYKKDTVRNICAPAYVLGSNPNMPVHAILPADMRVLKKVLPLKRCLLGNTKVVVLSFNQYSDEEKMLMGYVQRHCRHPGYMYLEQADEARRLRLLQQDTLVVLSQADQNTEMVNLQEHAVLKTDELNLSFLVV